MADCCFQHHISLHEFLPHKAWSFTGDGMTKYPHRSMWCCNDAVGIMPRWLPLQRWCHFLCYIFKEWIQKIPGNSWSGQWNQTDHNPEMETIILWGITVNELQSVHPPGMADTGCLPWGGWWRPVNPKQFEYFLKLAHHVCWAVGGFPTPKLIEIALHILKENRSQATVPF